MDRVAQEAKMKEKENEITDLADCTNHAYRVLWLARRIQHLWITVAIIVHEGAWDGDGRRAVVCVSLNMRVAQPGRCLCVYASVIFFLFFFSWHDEETEGR